MERVVEPELLDQLSPSDPRAVHSRRDLRWINLWMGNLRWISERLSMLAHPPRRILEIGSGDGFMMSQIARHFAPVWGKNISVTLLDKEPAIPEKTRDAIQAYGWQLEILKADLRLWSQNIQPAEWDVIVANLFLHHFSGEKLRTFFGNFAFASRCFLACEPRRSKASLLAARFLWLLGCNSVTRHDAGASIHAGFKGKELTSLWPREGFTVEEYDPGIASHVFFADKKETPAEG
jgi:hypothetical protein